MGCACGVFAGYACGVFAGYACGVFAASEGSSGSIAQQDGLWAAGIDEAAQIDYIGENDHSASSSRDSINDNLSDIFSDTFSHF